MKIKRLISTVAAGLLALQIFVMPCYAANDTSQTAMGDGSSTCTVNANISASFSVSLPATLALAYNDSNGKYENTFTVGVKGVISDSQYVSVVPDSSFVLSNTGHTSSRTASVTQSVTKWNNNATAADEIAISNANYVTTTGKVSVELPSLPDDYTGSFTFTYSIVN